jgi:hypothetical protein
MVQHYMSLWGYLNLQGSAGVKKQLTEVHLEVFWVVTPYNAMVGYQRFRGPCCLLSSGCNGGSMDLWNHGILQQHYMTSQPRSSNLTTQKGVSNAFIREVCHHFMDKRRLTITLLYFFLLSLVPQLSLGLGLLHKIRLNFLEASQQFSFFTG